MNAIGKNWKAVAVLQPTMRRQIDPLPNDREISYPKQERGE
jgi:hypothetical protein